MKIKIYEKYPDGLYEYHDDSEIDKSEVVSVVETEGNYVVILKEENYFGKNVYVYDTSRFLVLICNFIQYPEFVPYEFTDEFGGVYNFNC